MQKNFSRITPSFDFYYYPPHIDTLQAIVRLITVVIVIVIEIEIEIDIKWCILLQISVPKISQIVPFY